MKKADVSRTQGVSHETCIFLFNTILLRHNYANFHQVSSLCKIHNGINNDINGIIMDGVNDKN